MRKRIAAMCLVFGGIVFSPGTGSAICDYPPMTLGESAPRRCLELPCCMPGSPKDIKLP